MGVYEGHARISKLVRDLDARWHEMRLIWDDANSHSLEERCIRPVMEDARNALTAMDHLKQIVTQIKRDCG